MPKKWRISPVSVYATSGMNKTAFIGSMLTLMFMFMLNLHIFHKVWMVMAAIRMKVLAIRVLCSAMLVVKLRRSCRRLLRFLIKFFQTWRRQENLAPFKVSGQTQKARFLLNMKTASLSLRRQLLCQPSMMRACRKAMCANLFVRLLNLFSLRAGCAPKMNSTLIRPGHLLLVGPTGMPGLLAVK